MPAPIGACCGHSAAGSSARAQSLSARVARTKWRQGFVETALLNVRKKRPIVHCITNYVTVNDCANILLACGASPIMADDVREVEEIVELADALVINIGTLNARTIEAMLAAGRKANELDIPVVLDPVGAGSSRLRTETALRLLAEVRFAAVRANISEIKALTMGGCATQGVDANIADRVTEESLGRTLEFIKAFALKRGTIAVVTGEIDIATNVKASFCARNGHPMMASVTGTGCQLSALVAAFIAANPAEPLKAAAAAVCAMGLAGEIAHKRLTDADGNATYRNYIIDAIFTMTADALKDGARYEVR